MNKRAVATLNVKAENGAERYVLKLATGDTVGDLRRYLDEHRRRAALGGGGVAPGAYEIRSAFPARAYDDDETLESAALVPSAALFLKAVEESWTNPL